MTVELHNGKLTVDFVKGQITSLCIRGKERCSGTHPLFRLRLRDRKGEAFLLTAKDAQKVTTTPEGGEYTDFLIPALPSERGLRVKISLRGESGEAQWRISVIPGGDEVYVEWVDFPMLSLTKLKEESESGGEILLPYNEGVLISGWKKRQESSYAYCEPEYPSYGAYMIFPNMMFAQMQAYLWEDAGLYIGAHDNRRGVKGIDFYQADDGIVMQLRLFCGTDFGKPYEPEFPVVWAIVGNRWESAAERYRTYFESNLPPKAKKILDNDRLPQWYEEEPLVVGYPVRGTYDRGDMTPNRMYPYTNALPKLEEIQKAVDSRLLVLLMHWEGTAPWAPPYVWPPYGDGENFAQFREALREEGNLLGVYCSGFSYSIQSCMIPEYNKQKEFEERGLIRGMCAGPDGSVSISNICTMQRSGYDICPASEVGRAILQEAYEPLLTARLDYSQILDQNHGGGQYFCYSREHGHPPAPGAWMTENMQALLAEWNERAGSMLLGCESAAAEPYIGNLLFSDNRYELNYRMGVAVPLYAYLYHEYLRNFMGNQVGCPMKEEDDRHLWYRLAYSFLAGDCMTLILDQDGQIKSRWGKPKSDHIPNQEKILRLVKRLTAFYHEQAKPYLFAGRMIESLRVDCPSVTFDRHDLEGTVTLPAILTTAWETPDGRRAQLLVNPTEEEICCSVGEKPVTIEAFGVMLLER